MFVYDRSVYCKSHNNTLIVEHNIPSTVLHRLSMRGKLKARTTLHGSINAHVLKSCRWPEDT